MSEEGGEVERVGRGEREEREEVVEVGERRNVT